MRILTALLTLALLAGCGGLSPQRIDVQPSLSRGESNLGNNSAVNLTVVDQRSSNDFGTRGGFYRDTALIQPANDVAASLGEALKRALQERGYNAYNPGENSTALEVRLVELRYVPEAGTVVNRVDITGVIDVRASQGERSYSNSYRHGNTYEQPLTPSASRNEIMINEVTTALLERLLADERLHAFLNGN